jgi:hypothetical protein
VINRPRVIVSLANSVERTAIADWLRSDGFEPVPCSTPEAAEAEMLTPFALLIADETHRRLLTQHRSRHPQAPAILIGNAATVSHGNVLGTHTTYLGRPIERTMLMCFVSMAILDTRPARRSIRKAVSPFEATAHGIPSLIVDVSAEGLRLEMTRERRSALPPQFIVRIPLVGVAVTVQRMWTHSAVYRNSTVWYGAALSGNRTSIVQAWHTFVDAAPVVI